MLCHRQGTVYRLLGLWFRDDDIKARAALAVVCEFWVYELTESVVRLGVGITGHGPDRGESMPSRTRTSGQ